MSDEQRKELVLGGPKRPLSHRVRIANALYDHAKWVPDEINYWLDQLLAEHAHELAEKQRAKLIADGYGPSEETGDGTCPCESCSWCLAQDYIDLIDPKKEG